MNQPQSELISDNAAVSAQKDSKKTWSLAKRITGWTNNILATSVVVVVALACGSQLVSMWGDSRRSGSKSEQPAAMTAWPTMESCALEFGNKPYQLVRERFQGDRSQVIDQLSQQCRDLLELMPDPVGPIGPAEVKMIKDSANLQPIAKQTGRWRLFQVEDPQGNSLPMVIGIRDNCEGESSSRLVAWGIGLANAENDWTTYVCRSDPKSSTNPGNFSNFPLPNGSRRTLSISDHNGGRLIGFTGGTENDAMRFFDRWAENRGWSTINQWQRLGQSWHARFAPIENAKQVGFSVQLAEDPTQTLRGLLMVEPNTLEALNRNATE